MAQKEHTTGTESIDFRVVFESMSGSSVLLRANPPVYNIITVTKGYLNYSPLAMEELIGKGLFEIFPSNPEDKNDTGESSLRASFARVIQYGHEDVMEKQRYDVLNKSLQFEERYWRASNKPVPGNEGQVSFIIHTVEEITDSIKGKEAQAKVGEMMRMNNVFMQAPIAIHILKGPELIIEMANDRSLEIWGRTKDIIGKPINEVLPELLKQGYIDTIHKVRETGKPVYAYERPMVLKKNDPDGPGFYNFVVQPYYEADGSKAEGVLVFVNDVTEKVRSQNALTAGNVIVKESEERFRTMADGTEILITVSDETGGTIYFNKAWVDLTGRSVEGLLSFGWIDLIHEEDRQKFTDHYIESFKMRTPFAGEFRILSKEGEYRWLYAKGPVRFRPDGSFAGYISSAVDITERKNTENALQESEHRYRMLIEESPVATAFYTGREFRLQYANNIMIGYWGKGPDVIGQELSAFLPELKGQSFFKILDDVYTTGIAYVGNQEKVSLLVNGEMQDNYYSYTYKALKNKEGEIYGIHHVAVDVTNEVLAKKALEESKDQLQFAIEATELGTFDYNPLTNKFSANDRLKEWFGLKPENETALADAINAIAEKDRDRVTEAIKNALDIVNGGRYEIEYLIKNPVTGKEIYVRAKGRACFNEDYVAYRFNGTLQDVTQQVIAMQKVEELVAERTTELGEANKNLQRSNAELAQFAYIASHDLQEPLRKISTYSQMLESSLGDNLTEKSKNYFTKMYASASRMLTLIRDVLAYSQLSTTQNLLEKTDLNTVVENVKTDFELLIEQKHATIKAEGLPVLEAIPLQMSQLFTNLISNALKFIKPGVDPVINISAVKMSRAEVKAAPALDLNVPYYKISFEDNGIGFEQEYAEQIFNIFQRLHLKSAYEGTGIGLALCKKIAQNHHGDIYAESKKNKGAAFNIILPEVQAIG
jgi:PAS domain S-box-containing protein